MDESSLREGQVRHKWTPWTLVVLRGHTPQGVNSSRGQLLKSRHLRSGHLVSGYLRLGHFRSGENGKSGKWEKGENRKRGKCENGKR
jgi:hypothetical protein